MSTFSVKGMRIGVGRPKTIVPLLDATLEGLLVSARRAVAAGADCVEWRADFWEDTHDADNLSCAAAKLVAALPATPIIATLRTKGQGGRLEADAREYECLVRALVWGGADLVDIELGMGDHAVRSLVEEVHRAELRAIVSHHDFERTPSVSSMEQILLTEAGMGADICKLAVMAKRPSDAARLMEATSNVAQLLGYPLLTMAMGPAGAVTRLAGEAFGSAMTFCALGEASAPGQVGLATAAKALDALHAALGSQNDEPAAGKQAAH